jgi:dihydroorotate dehydrogenase (NAD+) catalytic subunit
MTDTTVDLGRGLVLKNPVMSASGTFGYGEEASAYFSLSELGAVIVKGISLLPRQGNPPPRIVETPAGMLNSIGLQNVGAEVFVTEKLPFLLQENATVIVNILGGSIEEYLAVTERLSSVEGIGALEVNISCPNVKEGGVQFGMRPDLASGLVAVLREATHLHLMVKLSPNAGDITRIAEAVQDAGADSVSLINTVTGMDIDIQSRKPSLGGIFGGLSGPAIRPVALRMVYEVSRSVDIPVVGLGGISEPDHALKFLIAGACAVQVGTATFVDPMAPVKIAKGIERYLEEFEVGSLSDIVGSLIVPDGRNC